MNIEHDKSRPFANDPNNPEPDQKQYGLYQLCPKCEGEGEIRDKLAEEEDPPYCTCPICNGARLLVRPEIKEEPGI